MCENDSSSPARRSIPLDYAAPRDQLLRDDDVRRIIRLSLSIFLVVAIGTAYCQIGIRCAQRLVGSGVLFKPATGTDQYDYLFIEIPWLILTAALAVVCAAALFPLRRSKLFVFVPVTVVAIVSWIVFVLVNMPLWEDMSP